MASQIGPHGCQIKQDCTIPVAMGVAGGKYRNALMRIQPSFRRNNVVHTVDIPRRIPSAGGLAPIGGRGLGLLARVEGELRRLHQELARLKADEAGSVLAGPGSVGESFAVRALRQRIEALETLIPVSLTSRAGVVHEVGNSVQGPFGESPRLPRHLSIDLPASVIDPEAEEKRSAVLADLLSANLELRRRLLDHRSGA